MSVVLGRYHDGKVVLDTPVDWPEGVPVQVSPTIQKIGMTESDWPTTPGGIQELIERIQTFEPVELTPDEEAEWMAARDVVKQYTLKKMEEQEDLFE